MIIMLIVTKIMIMIMMVMSRVTLRIIIYEHSCVQARPKHRPNTSKPGASDISTSGPDDKTPKLHRHEKEGEEGGEGLRRQKGFSFTVRPFTYITNMHTCSLARTRTLTL